MQGYLTAGAFLTGAATSMLCGFLGMMNLGHNGKLRQEDEKNNKKGSAPLTRPQRALPFFFSSFRCLFSFSFLLPCREDQGRKVGRSLRGSSKAIRIY